MITKDEFVTQLEWASTLVSPYPVSASVLRCLCDTLKKGEPAWWKRTQKAWEKRQFVWWMDSWRLFLTCLHFEALDDAECQLVPYFPSCGGTAEADPSTALARFLADAPASFYENLKSGQRPTPGLPLAIAWQMAGMYFQRRKLEYYVLEVDAGSGINLVYDVVRPFNAAFDHGFVAARIALDPSSLMVDDIKQRRWITAGLFPDDAGAIAELDKAIDLYKGNMRKDPNFIQSVSCPIQAAPKFVAKNVPPTDTDVGLLVCNFMATSRMTDAEYRAYTADMTQMLSAWGERGLWLEGETVRGELYSTTLTYWLRQVSGGALRSVEMGRVNLKTRDGRFDLRAVQQFFAAGRGPASPPPSAPPSPKK